MQRIFAATNKGWTDFSGYYLGAPSTSFEGSAYGMGLVMF